MYITLYMVEVSGDPGKKKKFLSAIFSENLKVSDKKIL